MIGTTLALKLLGGVTGASLLATGVLLYVNQGKDLKAANDKIERYETTIEQQAAHITLLETAALERLADNESLSEQEQELKNALQISDPNSRRVAFGCGIMRQQQASGIRDDLPAECGPAS